MQSFHPQTLCLSINNNGGGTLVVSTGPGEAKTAKLQAATANLRLSRLASSTRGRAAILLLGWPSRAIQIAAWRRSAAARAAGPARGQAGLGDPSPAAGPGSRAFHSLLATAAARRPATPLFLPPAGQRSVGPA